MLDERIKFFSGHGPRSLVDQLWYRHLPPGTKWHIIAASLLGFWFFLLPLYFIYLADTNLKIDESIEEDQTKMHIFEHIEKPKNISK